TRRAADLERGGIKVNLNEWYERGIPSDKYIASLAYHKDNFLHVYHHFTPYGSDDFFEAVKEKRLRVIVISEIWCGHCMLNIPILLRLAEKTNMNIRFIARDENVELMDRYLTTGKRIIPIVRSIDGNGKGVATWGSVAESTKQHVAQYQQQLPPKDAPDYEEKFKQFIKQVSTAFREETDIWNGTYESMKQTIEQIK